MEVDDFDAKVGELDRPVGRSIISSYQREFQPVSRFAEAQIDIARLGPRAEAALHSRGTDISDSQLPAWIFKQHDFGRQTMKVVIFVQRPALAGQRKER